MYLETTDDAMALARAQWRPIAEAPWDGTWVLLTGGRIRYGWDGDTEPSVVCGQYSYFCNTPSWQFAWYDGGYYGEYEQPTHFMPLPPAPEQTP